jgi:hypothetical protein
MISRGTLFSLVAIVCIINGLLSPWLVIAFQIVPILMPELFPRTVGWALFFSSVFVSTATLFGSGILPALYERFFERRHESTASMWLWLSIASVLSLPALQSVDKLF